MLQPLEMLETQVSRLDQQLQLHLIYEQQETNRLLRQLLEHSIPEAPEVVEEVKRPELMKRMANLSIKPPQGWNKWDNMKIMQYLKGVS